MAELVARLDVNSALVSEAVRAQLSAGATLAIRRDWPIRDLTGNARRGWRCRVTATGFEIHNHVGYAWRADAIFAGKHRLPVPPAEAIVRRYLASDAVALAVRAAWRSPSLAVDADCVL